jgi:AcrR family transcriptional regulator
VSPQRSNRTQLIEGTLRCLERLPPERITARAIAEASGANIASINYHFGSKDALVTEAAIEGLDRWLAEIDARLGDVDGQSPEARFRSAVGILEDGRRRHTGLARSYLAALAKAQHEDRLRELLANGFHRARPNVAGVLGLGTDQPGQDAAGLVLGLFHGMLLQVLLDESLSIDGDRFTHALERLSAVLAGEGA